MALSHLVLSAAILPDGSMNEAGLTVSEMGLGESVFSFADSLPTMLSHLWIQYQLDNYATVEEVLDHLQNINIELMNFPTIFSNSQIKLCGILVNEGSPYGDSFLVTALQFSALS